MSKPALSQVPDRGPQPLVGRAEPGITPRSLHSCGLHAAAPIGTARLSEQTPPLPPALPRQRATLLEVAADPQHLGAEIGFLSVLHTWGQNLQHHRHVHCVIPAGGLSPDHSRWIHPRYSFFLPVKILRRVFRGSLWPASGGLSGKGNWDFTETKRRFAIPSCSALWFVPCSVRIGLSIPSRPLAGPEYVLHYLARYTHRVAISNHRLLNFQDGQVTFRWRDYAHGNKKRKMTLTADEFLRR